ncbi:MAG TPA: hypothetical protein VHN99_01545, partial [Deinococcales bacterium]|nr:hypothetical protein [Deinococcales bacterium]
VLAFALDAETASALTGPALNNAPRGALFWFFHPKGSSGRQTNLSRDRGWDALKAASFTQVASVSLDDTWSGLRFRPQSGS